VTRAPAGRSSRPRARSSPPAISFPRVAAAGLRGTRTRASTARSPRKQRAPAAPLPPSNHVRATTSTCLPWLPPRTACRALPATSAGFRPCARADGHLFGDPLLASAAMDRLLHDAHVLVFDGDSYRSPPPARRRRGNEEKKEVRS